MDLQNIMAAEMNKLNPVIDSQVISPNQLIPQSFLSQETFSVKVPQTNLAYKIAKSLIESKMIELKNVDELFKIVEKIETLL